ncbi:uncharacterized protein LOC128211495 [Mya arenaria]|uniref:uncharacterized protein LOC128211495 n=1 Tax=Mya arenaria TaxID=6604 RepID=UPI0022E44FEF|nr:uncharacterized protein LOC128211495 [Mya arenaria]
MLLKPSEIFFSQNNISYSFSAPGRFKDNRIGDTLDDIIKGNIKVHQFPPISVTKKPGGNKWFTLDNRRLWIFHRLEAHGMCKEIDVNVVEYSLQHGRKFTSNNGGVAISVRGFPGGEWVRRITPVVPKCVQPKTPDKSETPLETTATTFSSTSSVDNVKSISVTDVQCASDVKFPIRLSTSSTVVDAPNVSTDRFKEMSSTFTGSCVLPSMAVEMAKRLLKVRQEQPLPSILSGKRSHEDTFGCKKSPFTDYILSKRVRFENYWAGNSYRASRVFSQHRHKYEYDYEESDEELMESITKVPGEGEMVQTCPKHDFNVDVKDSDSDAKEIDYPDDIESDSDESQNNYALRNLFNNNSSDTDADLDTDTSLDSIPDSDSNSDLSSDTSNTMVVRKKNSNRLIICDRDIYHDPDFDDDSGPEFDEDDRIGERFNYYEDLDCAETQRANTACMFNYKHIEEEHSDFLSESETESSSESDTDSSGNESSRSDSDYDFHENYNVCCHYDII